MKGHLLLSGRAGDQTGQTTKLGSQPPGCPTSFAWWPARDGGDGVRLCIPGVPAPGSEPGPEHGLAYVWGAEE